MSEGATRALDQLETLFKEPNPQTTLVLVAASVDKRSRMYKLLVKHATLVECGLVEDRDDAERWIRTRVAAAGAQIDPAAARLLADRGGTDVKRLRADVERLLLYALGQKSLTVEDVRQIAGPAALQDDWAITNAIEAGEVGEALRQLALTLDAGAPPEKILGQLGWVVRAKFPVVAPRSCRPPSRRCSGRISPSSGPRDPRSFSSGWSSSCARETGERVRAILTPLSLSCEDH